MLADFRPPFFSDAASSLVLGQSGDVGFALSHRVRVAAKEPNHVRHSPVPDLDRLDRRIPPPILLRQRTIQRLHPLLDLHRITIHRSALHFLLTALNTSFSLTTHNNCGSYSSAGPYRKITYKRDPETD